MVTTIIGGPSGVSTLLPENSIITLSPDVTSVITEVTSPGGLLDAVTTLVGGVEGKTTILPITNMLFVPAGATSVVTVPDNPNETPMPTSPETTTAEASTPTEVTPPETTTPEGYGRKPTVGLGAMVGAFGVAVLVL